MSPVDSARDLGIDSLRVAAIALLLTAHGVAIFYSVFPQQRLFWFLGCWGMDLFFVLGGYLLARRVLSTPDIRISELLGERFWRIVPNYALFLLLGVVLAWLADGEWRMPVRYWLFIQNFERPHPSFLPELWGLATAVSSGCCLLLAHLMVLRRLGSRAALALVVGLIVAANLLRLWHVYAADPVWDEGVKKITLWRLDAMSYGFLAAHWQYADWSARVRRGWWALAAAGLLGLALLGYALADENHSVFARSLLFTCDGIGFAALLLCVVGADELRAAAAHGAVELWARRSYALFLCHLPVLRIMELFHFPRDRWLPCIAQTLAYLALSLLLAALVFRYWEQRWRWRH